MTLLSRVLDRTKTSVQDWMDRSRVPQDPVEQELAELEREMETALQTAAAMIGTERELLSRLQDAAHLCGELDLRGEQAAEEGRDYVAKQMLEEKRHYEEIIREVRVRYQEAHTSVQGLVDKLYVMKEQAFQLRKRLQAGAN